MTTTDIVLLVADVAVASSGLTSLAWLVFTSRSALRRRELLLRVFE